MSFIKEGISHFIFLSEVLICVNERRSVMLPLVFVFVLTGEDTTKSIYLSITQTRDFDSVKP